MTSMPSKASASALPEKWVARLFDLMGAIYGARFDAMWQAQDIAFVQSVWAQRLARFSDHPEAIRQAMEDLNDCPHPPTLPEFAAMCAAKLPAPDLVKRSAPLTAEEHARAADMLRLCREAFPSSMALPGPDKRQTDPLDWLKRPRTQTAVNLLIDAARRDDRLDRIARELVSSGVISDTGQLLKNPDGSLTRAGNRRAAA
jgi:hypothetical protein